MGFPSLVLGALDLTDYSGIQYGISLIAEGTTRGAPVPIEVAVKSWLQDGSIVVTQNYDNRTVTLRVRIQGADTAALADAEAALFAELGKPNTLTWTPGDGFGAATVFEVVTSSMEHDDAGPAADLAEARAYPFRSYNVRLLCKAFTRSATETVATALPATGTTTTLVNDGSATTNWTGAVDGGSTAPSVVSGAVKVTGSSVPFTSRVSATLTTAITTSSTKYLQVDWKPESGDGSPRLYAYGDGVALAQAAETVSPTAGFTRTWFGPVAASSIAALKLEAVSVGGAGLFGGSTTRSLYVDNINRTDVKPSFGSGRQLLRSIDVGGSAPRAPGSLSIEHASSSLGDVMAYFYPDSESVRGCSPPLRQCRVSGGTVTSDSTLVSGAREDISTSGAGTAVVFDVPLANLARGLHLLVIRIKTNYALAPATVSWSAQLRINATNVGGAISGTGKTVVATNAAQTIYPVGEMNLPPADAEVTGSSAVVRITLSISGDVGAVSQFDEAWLFNTSIGKLLGPVPCGTGTAASGGPANRLFTEPPTPDRPRDTVRIGFAANRSDSFYPPGMLGWQLPTFWTGRTNVFTVATNAADASVTLRYYKPWHTNAAD